MTEPVDCDVCSMFDNPGRARELWIHDDELVLLGHVAPSPESPMDGYPGHLLLVPRRHIESPAALTTEEAQRVGLWLALGSRILETEQHAEHVYLLRLGDGWRHLHYHFVPRYPGTPEDYRGLEVRDWEGVPRCDWAQAAEIAVALRRAGAQLTP